MYEGAEVCGSACESEGGGVVGCIWCVVCCECCVCVRRRVFVCVVFVVYDVCWSCEV